MREIKVDGKARHSRSRRFLLFSFRENLINHNYSKPLRLSRSIIKMSAPLQVLLFGEFSSSCARESTREGAAFSPHRSRSSSSFLGSDLRVISRTLADFCIISSVRSSGMGGIGSTYAIMLQLAGVSVSVIARSNLKQIQEKGLDFESSALGSKKGIKFAGGMYSLPRLTLESREGGGSKRSSSLADGLALPSSFFPFVLDVNSLQDPGGSSRCGARLRLCHL